MRLKLLIILSVVALVFFGIAFASSAGYVQLPSGGDNAGTGEGSANVAGSFTLGTGFTWDNKAPVSQAEADRIALLAVEEGNELQLRNEDLAMILQATQSERIRLQSVTAQEDIERIQAETDAHIQTVLAQAAAEAAEAEGIAAENVRRAQNKTLFFGGMFVVTLIFLGGLALATATTAQIAIPLGVTTNVVVKRAEQLFLPKWVREKGSPFSALVPSVGASAGRLLTGESPEDSVVFHDALPARVDDPNLTPGERTAASHAYMQLEVGREVARSARPSDAAQFVETAVSALTQGIERGKQKVQERRLPQSRPSDVEEDDNTIEILS